MSVVTLPAVGFTLTIPDTTTLVRCDDIQYGEAAREVPPNCRSVVVYNMDATNRIFIQWNPTTEVNPTSMTVLNSTVLPALASMTFAIGYLGDRPNLAGHLDTCLFFMAEAGVSLQVNVTYLMGRGTQLL
jgi:hypothetical protein